MGPLIASVLTVNSEGDRAIRKQAERLRPYASHNELWGGGSSFLNDKLWGGGGFHLSLSFRNAFSAISLIVPVFHCISSFYEYMHLTEKP